MPVVLPGRSHGVLNHTGLWLWVPARASLGRDDGEKPIMLIPLP
jgi:hypothetical protein